MSPRKDFNPIVSIPREIIFGEPSRKHPGKSSDNQTIADVAKHLEKDYSPIHIFYRKYKTQIKSVIIQEVQRAWKNGREQKTVNEIIAERIKLLFRQFIVRDESGIKTKAAQSAGRQSFLDTGAYYKSMVVRVE